MPMYPQMANQMEQQDAASADFWRKKWQEFNPQFAVRTGQSLGPQYSGLESGIGNDAMDSAASQGFAGDMASMLRKSRAGLERQRMGQEIGTGNQAFFGNAGDEINASTGGFQKGGDLMGMSMALSRLPQQRAMAWAQEGDAVERMKKAYKPLTGADYLATAAGGAGGQYLGDWAARQMSRKRNSVNDYPDWNYGSLQTPP